MGTIISLSTPNLDWEILARTVERTGMPIWLELEGTVQGVLLPSSAAHRLMGRYTQARREPTEETPAASTQADASL